jgi:hypothetical protein
MIEERVMLTELLEKAGDGDLPGAVAEAVLQLLMETDVDGLIGVGRCECSGERALYGATVYGFPTTEPPRLIRGGARRTAGVTVGNIRVKNLPARPTARLRPRRPPAANAGK